LARKIIRPHYNVNLGKMGLVQGEVAETERLHPAGKLQPLH
jgi:hypothetical protein